MPPPSSSSCASSLQDPYLTGVYAREYVQGAQEGEDPNYVMLSMALKHFAVYEEETNRFGSNANVTMFDLLDTCRGELAPFSGRRRGTLHGREANRHLLPL